MSRNYPTYCNDPQCNKGIQRSWCNPSRLYSCPECGDIARANKKRAVKIKIKNFVKNFDVNMF